MSKRKRQEEEESGYKTEKEFYEGEWENLQNELLRENDKRLTDDTKFELSTIMVGDKAPAHNWDAAAKYKFLDTIRINRDHSLPIEDTLEELHRSVISNDKKKEIKGLLEVIRTNAQGGRKRKRRRGTKKKRRKRNLKKRTRRRRRKSKRRRRR